MKIVYKNIYEWQKPVLTEKYAYDLLKESPLKSEVTYLAVAWSTLIDKLDFGSPEAKVDARNHLQNLKQLNLTNAFTVCQHDRFHLILPTLKKAGVGLLFASHMVEGKGRTTAGFSFPPTKTKPYKINGIEIDTILLAPVFTGEPNKHKDILYSFVGSCGTKHISDIREKIFEDNHETNAVFIFMI